MTHGEEPKTTTPAAWICMALEANKFAQVSNELLQLLVLFFEHLQSPHFGDAESRILPLPAIERLFRDSHLADNLRHGRARLMLTESKRYLLLRITLPFYRSRPPIQKW